jgi:hypothetical protein
MFTSEQILERLRQVPFQPFRFVIAEGRSYEIRHPDLVIVGRNDITIGFPDAKTPTIYDRQIRVAIFHIVGIEDAPSTQVISNGSPLP